MYMYSLAYYDYVLPTSFNRIRECIYGTSYIEFSIPCASVDYNKIYNTLITTKSKNLITKYKRTLSVTQFFDDYPLRKLENVKTLGDDGFPPISTVRAACAITG